MKSGMNGRMLKAVDRTVGRCLTRVLGWIRFRASAPLGRTQHSIRRVLIIRPGGIGDAVLLVPALRVLRQRIPSAEIDVLAEARNAGVFALCDAVTAVLLYHRVTDLFRVMTRPYDVVIDTEQWHRLSAVLAFLTRSPVRVGFATNERARLFTHRVPYTQSSYEARSFLDLVVALTGRPDAVDPVVPYVSVQSSPERDRAQPSVVLFPGASVPERRWGSERFGDLARCLVQHGCHVTVVGGAGDVEQSRRICTAGGPQVSNCAGSLSLKAVAEIFAGSDVVVTADSGLMHLAVAVGAPTVSLFGAGIREKWAPRGERHRVLSAELPCSPCTRFGYTPPCPIGVECLRLISVDDVLAVTLDVIKKYGRVNSRRKRHDEARSLSQPVVGR